MKYYSSLIVFINNYYIVHAYIPLLNLLKLKDQRYKAIKSLIENDNLKGLTEVFTIVPITVVKTDLKINYNTLRKRIYNGHLLTVKDIMGLANLFEVKPEQILHLILLDNLKVLKATGKK